MLSVALSTMRARWTGFVGTFLALALGVGLIATMGLGLAATFDAPTRPPERFASAPVVVRGQDAVRVTTEHGEKSKPLPRPHPVPASVARELEALGLTVEDRSFAVRVDGGPDGLVGHPWSTAAFAPYELTGGRAPRTAGEVVASGTWARVGERLRTGRGDVTVVGTVGDRGFEEALFYTDAQAARVSPRIDAVVVLGTPASAVRAEVPAALKVLTGDDRRLADADPERDEEALMAVNALLGTAAGVTGFVSVFVVASTFAFAVARRRRELGLLRLAGATGRQIRRMVLREALAVGVLASATGCVLGGYGAPLLTRWLVDNGTAPRWFTVGSATWPYHLAFWSGLLVALCGALTASWRAGRTGPTQALREASVDTATMPWARRILGGGLLVTGLGLLGYALLADPGELLHRKTYILRPMLLITACALLAPVLVRPLVRLLTWPAARLRGAGGLLVRENAAAGIRRSAAIAAPVLVTVALTGSLLGTVATLNKAKATEMAAQTRADYVVTAPEGLDRPTVDRIGHLPGVTASATASTSVFVVEEGTALIRSDARAVDPAALARVSELPVAAGELTDLDDDSIIVNEEWAQHRVGEHITVHRADGTPATLTIAAVLRTGTGGNGAYVTARNAPYATVDRIDVRVTGDGTDRETVARELRTALTGTDATVRTRDAWLAAHHPAVNEHTRIGFLVVLGLALLYTAISLANTLIMATSDRTRDLTTLRLTGATPRQTLRLLVAETLTVVTAGAVLGTAVAGVNLLGVWGALGLLDVWSPPVVPWRELGAVTAGCAVIGLFGSVIPGAVALRARRLGHTKAPTEI